MASEIESGRNAVPRDDPYAPPSAAGAAAAVDKTSRPRSGSGWWGWLRSYLSPAGSFSRLELLGATLFLGALGVLLSTVSQPPLNWLSPVASVYLTYALYPIWGAALGKRSRDLGTTFTYGMVLGMLFPLIGVVFLFQKGRK